MVVNLVSDFGQISDLWNERRKYKKDETRVVFFDRSFNDFLSRIINGNDKKISSIQ